MTSRERLLASLRCRPVDRFFRYEHGPWPTTRERWIREGYPADVPFASYFKMDPLFRPDINSGNTDSPYQPKFVVRTVEENAESRVYVDSDGILKREFKTARDTSMPQFIKFPVSNRKDWLTIRDCRLNPDDAAARIGDPDRLRAGQPALDVPTMLSICGVYGHPRNLFGEEGLSYVIFDDPVLLNEVLDNWLALYVALIRVLVRHLRVDVMMIWEDLCYRNGPLLSPDHFRQFMLPRYRELIQEARRCGIAGILADTDGHCTTMIPLFLEAGVDCLMPFEVQAGMDVVQIRRNFPTLGIMGGIDKRTLAEGTPSAIRYEVDRVLAAFGKDGGYIPTLDHSVPPNVSLQNFQFYLKCVRDYERTSPPESEIQPAYRQAGLEANSSSRSR